jgi:Domain of unknown function (DUF4149)
MTSPLIALRRVLIAMWLGSGVFFVAIAAPAAFRNAGSGSAAGDVVGAMLTRWHYIALLIPLALLLVEWTRRDLRRTGIVVVLCASLFFAAAEGALDLRMRSMRSSSPVPITELSRSDPLRRQFGLLHGLSAMLLLLQIVSALAVTAFDEVES